MLIFSPLLPRSFVPFFFSDHHRVPANAPARKRNRLFSSSSFLFELRFSLFALRLLYYTLTPLSLSPYLDLFVSFQIWLFRVRF